MWLRTSNINADKRIVKATNPLNSPIILSFLLLNFVTTPADGVPKFKCPPELLARIAQDTPEFKPLEFFRTQMAKDKQWLDNALTRKGRKILDTRLQELATASLTEDEQQKLIHLNEGPSVTIIRKKMVMTDFESPFGKDSDSGQYTLIGSASESPIGISLNGIQQLADFERGFFGSPSQTYPADKYGERVQPGLLIDALLTKEEKTIHWKGYSTGRINLGPPSN